MKHVLCLALVLLLFVGCLQAAEVPFVELKGHTASVNFAVFSPDGKKIISASMDDTARIWDTESGKELHKLEMRDGTLSSDAFSPDRKKMIVSNQSRTLRFLDAESGKELQTLRLTLGADSAMFSPDGKKIAAGGYDRRTENYTAHILDAESGKELHRFAMPSTSVYRGYFSPDGTKFLTRCFDKTARIWDVNSGKELHKLEGHTDVINTAIFSPDGTKVVTASRGLTKDDRRFVGTVYIWDVESGKVLHKFPELLGGVRDAVFSLDGKTVVTVNGKNGWAPSDARIWDADTGKALKVLEEAQDFIVFSPDGTKIVTGGTGHTAIIWDAESGKELQRLQGEPNSSASVGLYAISLISYDPKVSSVAFSPDGKRIVTASNDGTVRIWILEQ